MNEPTATPGPGARNASPSTLPRPDDSGFTSTPGAPGLSVKWARHQDEVRAAQRLRHDIFVGEMGARLHSPVPGHDIDLFDDFCEHLLVRDGARTPRA